MPTIDLISPDKATYRPGETAQVAVTLSSGPASAITGRLSLALVHIDEVVAHFEEQVALPAGGTTTLYFSMTSPPTPLRGYGLDATLYDEHGSVLAEGGGALDVLERWSQAPRYGFLSDFGPEQSEEEIAARCSSLRSYHLNVVQFYDWMWRHYKLVPPEGADEYTDALDRRLSLRAVKSAIACVQKSGAAAMAYGAVYGAEPEFVEQHPDLQLFDEGGKPISLAELFYIMNIAPDSHWVPLIVAEFADAVRKLDFDGIHLDQYGFPKTAVSAQGAAVDLALCFPQLIDRARAAVVAEKPEAGVIFNAVTNWPIETVAPTSQDVVYIEVWPPYDTYNDLRTLIREAKRLGGKQVILAAYLSPYLDIQEADIAGAEAAALLATAVIGASGGSHLLLGEGGAVLCDPYYPKYAHLRPSFLPTMRAYYDFLVRYEEFLIDPAVVDANEGRGASQSVERRGDGEAVVASADAESGAVWVLQRRKPGYRIVHLLNLADQGDVEWNALRTPPKQITSLSISIDCLDPVRSVLAVSPDAQWGRPVPVEWTQLDGVLTVQVPALQTWTALICKLEDSSC